MTLSPPLTAIGLLIVALTLPVAAQAKMYRWVDDQGKTHFSDVVPPDQAKFQRDTLNKAAQVVATSEKAKSREQYEQEQHMQALRQEQDKLIAKQETEDRVLLSTYRSLEDMELTLTGRMQALDAQRRVAEGNLKRLQHQLESQQKKAAEQERNGQAVPKNLLNDIRSSEQQIQIATSEISAHVNKKSQVKAEFEASIERFKELSRGKNAATAQGSDAPVAALAGLFNCADLEQCDKAWTLAKGFVVRYSTMPITNTTDQLILTDDPAKENDLSLSVSRMQADNGQQKLFLDVRCHHSRLGSEFCAGKQATEIRSAFKPYLDNALK